MSRDLFSGLIRSDLGHDSFWGKYEHLNSVEIPTEAAMLEMQLNRLRALEKVKGSKYYKAHEFIQNAQKNMGQLPQQLDNAIEQDVYGRIISLLNTGLWGNVSANPTRMQREGTITAVQKAEEIDRILEEMTMLLKQVNADTGVSQQILETLEHRLRTQKSTENKSYTNLKADQAEALLVDALNKNEGWRAIQSGNFVDGLGQQIIEDVLAFDKATIYTPFAAGRLGFRVTSSSGKKMGFTASSVGNFLEKVGKLNGNFTVQLSDSLYEALQQGAAIAGQVKSGMKNQAILSRAQRNQISLSETGFCCGSLKELYDIQTKGNTWFKPEAQQNSKDLEALANYSLSKAIAKTAIDLNQLYYTETGFTTASGWMAKNKYIVKFKPGVTSMGSNFLSKYRTYQMYGIKKSL